MEKISFVEAVLRAPADYLRIVRAEKKAVPLLPTAEPRPSMEELRKPELTEAQAAVARLEQILEHAVIFSVEELGKGELPGLNNRGPDIKRFCAPHGDGFYWCAGFACYNLERAFVLQGYKLPFGKTLGAKRLAERIEKYGHSFTDPKLARRGDYILSDRGATGSLSGHIEIIETPFDTFGLIGVVPGNSAPTVKRFRRDIHDRKYRFNRFVSMRAKPRMA